MPMAKYSKAAAKCLERIARSRQAKLDSTDRAGMIAELAAVGVKIPSARGDAFVAARYDAAFNEEDHPRGEHGRFGVGGPAQTGSPSSEVRGSWSPHESGLHVMHDPSGDAPRRATNAEVHEYLTHGTINGSRDHSLAKMGPDKNGNLAAESLSVQEAREHLGSNPADKLLPGMREAAASAIANDMSKLAKKSGTAEAHNSAAAAHTQAAQIHRLAEAHRGGHSGFSVATTHSQKAAFHTKAAKNLAKK